VVPEVIAGCRAQGVPVIPGAFTPTEIHTAWRLGADLVKVFPADQLGPAYIRNVKAPLPQVRLVPTGGVTVETIAAYKRAGADGFGVGSPLFAKEKVAVRDWDWVEAQAWRFAEAYRAG
jgi:2-dehydro-3-deoxyphosphogluconate aldolase/(4S)-4-hydroxy-2-oxoglutarate aldolase